MKKIQSMVAALESCMTLIVFFLDCLRLMAHSGSSIGLEDIRIASLKRRRAQDAPPSVIVAYTGVIYPPGLVLLIAAPDAAINGENAPPFLLSSPPKSYNLTTSLLRL